MPFVTWKHKQNWQRSGEPSDAIVRNRLPPTKSCKYSINLLDGTRNVASLLNLNDASIGFSLRQCFNPSMPIGDWNFWLISFLTSSRHHHIVDTLVAFLPSVCTRFVDFFFKLHKEDEDGAFPLRRKLLAHIQTERYVVYGFKFVFWKYNALTFPHISNASGPAACGCNSFDSPNLACDANEARQKKNPQIHTWTDDIEKTLFALSSHRHHHHYCIMLGTRIPFK